MKRFPSSPILVLAAGLALALLVSCQSRPGPLAPAAPARWLVTAHGAVGDGVTVNTRALQSAIDALSAAGGGTLVVPAGVFLSGALYFKPGVNLLVEKGAVLKSTIAMADFPPLYTRWEGIERYWTSGFLNFIGLDRVEVSGGGTIDGSGDGWTNFGHNARRGVAPFSPPLPGTLPSVASVYPAPLPSTAALQFAPHPADLPPINAAGTPLPQIPLSPPRALVFQNCTRVRVSGLTLKNEARWGFVFLYCTDVVAANLTVRAEHYIPSSDGIDVDSCRQVLISGCDIDCNDDCISLKSGKDEDGRRVNRPCEDVIIEKTRFAYGHGGAAIGSETSGGIRRVEVRDCVAEAGNWAPIRFKSQPTRGGVVEDITYRNLELRDVRQAFEFSLAWNLRIASPGLTRFPPVVRHVKLIGIHGTARSAGAIQGLPDSEIDGIVFEDCQLTTRRGLTLAYARHVDTTGLALTVSEGPAIIRPGSPATADSP